MPLWTLCLFIFINSQYSVSSNSSSSPQNSSRSYRYSFYNLHYKIKTLATLCLSTLYSLFLSNPQPTPLISLPHKTVVAISALCSPSQRHRFTSSFSSTFNHRIPQEGIYVIYFRFVFLLVCILFVDFKITRSCSMISFQVSLYLSS